MKKFISILCAAIAALYLLTGCKADANNTIEVFVGENSFGYSVTGVVKNGDGTTTVSMEMKPLSIKEGDAGTNVMTLMQIGSSFGMIPYLVIDGQRVDVPENNAKMGIGGTENGGLMCVYTFIFNTDADPQELWLYPSGRSDDTDWHYKIDPQSYEILQRAAIESK
jgi:hypothetical protein